jgi:hypothetical protein
MIAFADEHEIAASAVHKCVCERPLKIVLGEIAIRRRAKQDGILQVIINNKMGETCSPHSSRTAGIVRRCRICHPAPQCCLANMAPTKSMCSCRALQERSGSTERFPQ